MSVSRRIAGVVAMTCLGGRVGAGREQLEQLGLGEVRRRPLGHEQARIALIDGLAREQLVALVEDAIEVLEDGRVLVLERVVVFVGEVEPLVRPGTARLRDHVELAFVVPIEAGDAAAQEVEAEGAQARNRPG